MTKEPSDEKIIKNIINYICNKCTICCCKKEQRILLTIFHNEEYHYITEVLYTDQILRYLDKKDKLLRKKGSDYKLRINRGQTSLASNRPSGPGIDDGTIMRYEMLKNKDLEYIEAYVDDYYNDLIEDLPVCEDCIEVIDELLIFKTLLEEEYTETNALVYKLFVIDKEFDYSEYIDLKDPETREEYNITMCSALDYIWSMVETTGKINIISVHDFITNDLYNNQSVKVI